MKILFTLLAFTISYSAFAAEDGPCAKDRAAYCAEVKSGEGRILKCMQDNEDKLSPECKEFRTKMKDDLKDVSALCHDDVVTLCPGLKKRELAKCLRSKKSQLSGGCKAEMKEMKSDIKKARKKH